MSNKKTTKRALLSGVLVMLLCITMLIGTTFAWFTDSVTSGNNIIKSGNLDIKMSYSDSLDGNYIDVEEKGKEAIFNYNLWEPGYTEVKYVKIENAGSLAFKYVMDIVPMYSGSSDSSVDLAEVIDVYYAVAPAAGVTRETYSSMDKAGTLAEIISTDKSALNGVLLPDGADTKDKFYAGEVIVCIALHMQEEAGNEYQNLSIGDGFDIELYATQYTYEEDSFDDQYDANAAYELSAAVPTAGLRALDASEYPDGSTVKHVDLTSGSLGAAYSNAVPLGTTVDTAYLFTAQETYEEALKSEYAYWNADYVVSFDKDVKTGEAGLIGNYGSFGWISFDAPMDIAANTKIRLLNSVGFLMNYSELCRDVKNFYCGAFDYDGNLAGATITVELRLYETKDPADTATNTHNEETGRYVVVNKTSYTFQ